MPQSGAWLLETGDRTFPLPEALTDEQRMAARTASDFVTGEVMPALPRLESKDWALSRHLLRRCGELGLLGLHVPEAFGGTEVDTVTSLLVSEQFGRVLPFGTTWGGQTNLCTIPLVLFGTPDQQARYLPGLTSGELVGAYALSEAGAGSDALSVRTVARRLPGGGYSLTGEKLWTTNGGFADLIVVFAQVDGHAFTAFLVERAAGGVTSGPEEHKMGLHGSSTTALHLENAIVPETNVLGEVGRGHKVAFTALNFGRFKLGAMCAGGCKQALAEAAVYAATRRQFGRPIAAFGAVQRKLGEMTARTYALEAVLHRTAGLIDRTAAAASARPGLRAALENVAIEGSIAKVFGSEVLDFVVDENVQIHGGHGYVADYPAERHYRDARVNRIFEGTNEINRLLIAGRLLKRAASGDLPFAAAALAVRSEVTGGLPPGATESDELGGLGRAAEACRKTAIMVAGLAMERFGAALQDEQEIVSALADILIHTFAAGSAVGRAEAAAQQAHAAAALHQDAAAIVATGALFAVEAAAHEALAAIAEGDQSRLYLTALRRTLETASIDTVAARRRLAVDTVLRGGYIF